MQYPHRGKMFSRKLFKTEKYSTWVLSGAPLKSIVSLNEKYRETSNGCCRRGGHVLSRTRFRGRLTHNCGSGRTVGRVSVRVFGNVSFWFGYRRIELCADEPRGEPYRFVSGDKLDPLARASVTLVERITIFVRNGERFFGRSVRINVRAPWQMQ